MFVEEIPNQKDCAFSFFSLSALKNQKSRLFPLCPCKQPCQFLSEKTLRFQFVIKNVKRLLLLLLFPSCFLFLRLFYLRLFLITDPLVVAGLKVRTFSFVFLIEPVFHDRQQSLFQRHPVYRFL